jgi:hypothetical protein
VDFCAANDAKIPIIRRAANLGSMQFAMQLQGKKAPCGRFFGILCVKRDKLPELNVKGRKHDRKTHKDS